MESLAEVDGSWIAALVGGFSFFAAAATSAHAILRKLDSRSAVAWVGLIWLLPLIGPTLYLLLGINRIRRRAIELRGGVPQYGRGTRLRDFASRRTTRRVPEALRSLHQLSDRVSQQPLLEGNEVIPLFNGDEAYPRMLAAIAAARSSITLSTYIFGNDVIGRRFVAELAAAVQRGVQVRVLIDAVGVRYSFPTILWRLRRQGIPFALFMPTRLPRAMPFFNLRNHRKILVVDGQCGFAGGMNIAAGNQLKDEPAHPVRDLHFEWRGPVVSELQAVFAEDWAFARRERLVGPVWFPRPVTPGKTLARVVVDGPDERYDVLRRLLIGALSVARTRICIQTPYFLPDATLQDTLITAAMRGVRVEVMLPGKNNLALVDWASRAQLANLIRWGVRVFFSPPPFDHSKLFTVDDGWCLVGSANWDPRSLALNFECNVECYDRDLAEAMVRFFDVRLAQSQQWRLADIERTPWLIQLRNGLARLFSPYL
ncbi:phospholipase D-like domain-containing protein [Hydrocarboniclastica marina]|uniref:Cardiolipin synthase n=1 Tax=Hydrocarboniclastica marina TaxID=2259620 RepID=A0A4P7XJL3_9ALTE|nr:phospholipase D-like domain-containing protein [Hydrocarboniclastica marina]QCF26985.1 cardiolipin synthase [Hydrocarboniclastica marina]